MIRILEKITQNKLTMKNYLLLIISLFFLSNCSKDDKNNFDTVNHFYENANQLQIEVAYEQGAQPYINVGGNNIWAFTQANISALFDGRNRPISVTVKNQLSEMTQIPNQNKNSYTNADIQKIANQYKQQSSTQNKGVVFLVFLDGYYDFTGTPEPSVVGVSVGSFVVAIFKPVIENIPTSTFSNNRPNVEQAFVVHEIGHALGLVNNGVDMEVDHQDVQHGKHCTNTNCIMYWQNEGASSMTTFTQGGLFGTSQPVIVFGQECLNDTRNYRN